MTARVQRRQFLSLFGGAALASAPAHAQQPALPVTGYLYVGTLEASAGFLAAFRRGLNESGYVEGGNVAIEFRFAQNDVSRLPELAADLVRRRVSVIAALGGITAAAAARAATQTIPIVFNTGADPVQLGLVASLNRPGGNVTGVTSVSGEVMPKRVGLLHELLPRAERFAVLVNPTNRNVEPVIDSTRAAAAAIGRQVDILNAATNREIDAAFTTLAQKRADALLIGPFLLFNNRRVQLATLATRHVVPAIHFDREFSEAGGLMSYGANIAEAPRQAGIYVGRILKGEKPADLPVVRASKFELVINLQTARTLGIEIPPTLLAQADEVIE